MKSNSILIFLVFSCSLNAFSAIEDIFKGKTEIENPMELRDPFLAPRIKVQKDSKVLGKVSKGVYSNIPQLGDVRLDDIEITGVIIGKERRAFIKIKNAQGNWQLLKPIDKSQISIGLDEYLKTPGIPVKYNLLGNSLFLYPKPDADQVTTASGLKIYVSRSVDALSASGDEPGFATEFHRILSLGAAQDFCVANQLVGKGEQIRREKERMEYELKTYFAQRHRAMGSKLIPHREIYK